MVMAAAAGGLIVGGMMAGSGGGSSAPPATDYYGAAQAQGQANIASAQAQTQLNRPNQITPWGSQTWYQGTPPGYGAPPGGSTGGGGPAMSGGGVGSGWTPGGGMIPSPSAGGGQAGAGGHPYSLGGGGGGAYGYGGQSQYQATGQGNGYSPANQWTSVTTLAPAQQALLNSQNNISQAFANQAQGQLGQVQSAEAKPFSTAGMPGVQYGPHNQPLQTSVGNTDVQGRINTQGVGAVPQSGDFGALQQKATDAAMSRQNIQLGQQQESLQAQLANQGITPGSDAYNRAMQPLEQSRVDAQNQAFLTGTQYENQLYGQAAQSNQLGFGEAQAQGQFANTAAGQQFSQNVGQAQFGNQAQGQQFSQGLQGGQFSNQAQQQAIGQEAYLRELPLNELNALRSGSQVQAPQFPQYNNAGAVAPAPIFGAAQATGAQNQAIWQAQTGAANNQMQGLYGLGGTALQAYMAYGSDRRLKRNIKRIGTTLRDKLPWYYFEYIWGEPACGVMADEAFEVIPKAVSLSRDGYAMVDYAQVA